jgi:signal transduction histidine kinase
MRPTAAEILQGLGADGALAARRALLDSVRTALDAEYAVLVPPGDSGVMARGTGTATAAPEIPPAAVAAVRAASEALEVPLPGGWVLLARALHPPADDAWCLGVLRRPGPWNDAHVTSFAALASEAVLVLEVAGLRETLAAAQARERETAAAHARLRGVLSHELRNPLAPILMWSGTLKRLRPQDPDCLRAVRAIEHAVGLQRRLIDDFAESGRVADGRLELRFEPVELCALLRRALDARRADCEEAGLSVVPELPPEPLVIHGDPGRLLDVVARLLDNAIKFTPRDGAVALALAQRGSRAELRVSDTGPGLAEEVVPHLFAPFVRGPNARGGLGVGLAMARGLVALHRGAVEALPVGDLGGTTIVVTLPLAAPWAEVRAEA